MQDTIDDSADIHIKTSHEIYTLQYTCWQVSANTMHNIMTHGNTVITNTMYNVMTHGNMSPGLQKSTMCAQKSPIFSLFAVS